MQPSGHRPAQVRHRRAAGVLLLALFGFLLTLSFSESLHQWFHSDAASPAHHCAVTLQTHGQIDVAPSSPGLPPAPMLEVCFAWRETPRLEARAHFHLHGRDPPVSIL